MKATLERHAVSVYIALTYIISWGGVLAVLYGRTHALATAEEFDQLLPLAALTLAAGPMIVGLAMTGVLSGVWGFRHLLGHLLTWRAPARLYAIALLTAPVLAAAALVPFALRSSAFYPPVLTKPVGANTLIITVVAALLGALIEELGWTGFAIPRVLRKHNVLGTGIIVGIAWSVWHFPVNFWGSSALSGGLPLTIFVPLYFLIGVAHLTGYRVLMVSVYDRTRSLLIAILMHAALIASTVQTVLTPPTKGVAFLAWFFVLTALFWVAAAVVLRLNRTRVLSQTYQP